MNAPEKKTDRTAQTANRALYRALRFLVARAAIGDGTRESVVRKALGPGWKFALTLAMEGGWIKGALSGGVRSFRVTDKGADLLAVMERCGGPDGFAEAAKAAQKVAEAPPDAAAIDQVRTGFLTLETTPSGAPNPFREAWTRGAP